MNNYILIGILIHSMINAFKAGTFFRDEDDKISVFTVSMIFLCCCIWIELEILSWIVSFFVWLYKKFMAITQLHFWFNYYTGKLDKMTGEKLLEINKNNSWIKAIINQKDSEHKMTFARKHQFYTVDLLNKKYEFDYDQYMKGLKFGGEAYIHIKEFYYLNNNNSKTTKS